MARTHRQQRTGKTQQLPRPSVGGSKGSNSPWAGYAFWGALLTAVLGALVWNQYTVFFFAWTDEQIHFYVARRMVEGAVLYRDIDSARPPLVLFPLAWLMKLGFGPLLAGRTMVLGTQLATAGLLLWGGWRFASARAGALAAILFLTSPGTFTNVHYTGIQLVALTTCACVLLFLRAQPLRSGLFFGLTLAADQHGIVVCGVVALLTLIRRPRDSLLFATGTLIVVTVVFGGVWVSGGRHLWESLVGVHLHHFRIGDGLGAEFWKRFVPWVYEHAYLFVGTGLAFALKTKRRIASETSSSPPFSGTVRVLILLLVVHVLVVLAMAEAAFLYIVVIAPMLSLLAAMGYDAAVIWWQQRSQMPKAWAQRAPRLTLAGVLAIVVVPAGGWSAARSHREHLDERQYSFWPHVLHGQVSRLQNLTFALRGICDSMLPREGTIFGDPMIVSALALQSGLRVSGELADLNHNWIGAGTVRREDVVSRIEADSVSAVITPPFGLVQDPYFKSYLLTCYEKPKPFLPPESGPGSGLPFFMVFSRKSGTCQVPQP